MPPVRGTRQLLDVNGAFDGFEIDSTRQGLISLRRIHLPGAIKNKSAAEVEVWINTWLDNQLGIEVTDPTDPDFGQRHYSFKAVVKVVSTNPLNVRVLCYNPDYDPGVDW